METAESTPLPAPPQNRNEGNGGEWNQGLSSVTVNLGCHGENVRGFRINIDVDDGALRTALRRDANPNSLAGKRSLLAPHDPP